MEELHTATQLQNDDQFVSNTFRRALLPALLSIGGVLASTLANSLIAGNLLGDEALAVLSLVNPIYFVFATIGSLAGAGAASYAAWCTGRNDSDGCNGAVTFAALLSLGVSLALALLGLVCLDPLLALLGAGGDLLEPTRQFAAVYLFSGIDIAGIYDDEWHTFALEWTPERYIFYIDGEQTWTLRGKWVCQVPCYAKLTVAVGGWAGTLDPSLTPLLGMQVDYIKVYYPVAGYDDGDEE